MKKEQASYIEKVIIAAIILGIAMEVTKKIAPILKKLKIKKVRRRAKGGK